MLLLRCPIWRTVTSSLFAAEQAAVPSSHAANTIDMNLRGLELLMELEDNVSMTKTLPRDAATCMQCKSSARAVRRPTECISPSALDADAAPLVKHQRNGTLYDLKRGVAWVHYS